MQAADAPLIIDSTGDFEITYKLTEDRDGSVKDTTGYAAKIAVSKRYDDDAPVTLILPIINATEGALGMVVLKIHVGSSIHVLKSLPDFKTSTEPDWHKNSLLNLEPHKADYNYIYQIYLLKGSGNAKKTELIVRGLLAIRD